MDSAPSTGDKADATPSNIAHAKLKKCLDKALSNHSYDVGKFVARCLNDEDTRTHLKTWCGQMLLVSQTTSFHDAAVLPERSEEEVGKVAPCIVHLWSFGFRGDVSPKTVRSDTCLECAEHIMNDGFLSVREHWSDGVSDWSLGYYKGQCRVLTRVAIMLILFKDGMSK